MKSISASIIILAGALLLLGALFYPGGDRTAVAIVGCGVVAAGFYGWFVSLKEK
jgi:lipopolysaccharide export LptBFGC system permease protein LptF